MKNKLTQKRLKELLHYDPETGVFTRILRSANCIQIGDIAGSIDVDGYNIISLDCLRYRASRLAILYTEGYWPENFVDHKNEIRHDDKRCNLREISNRCNQRNCGNSITNKSGVRGVSFIKRTGKWRASITNKGKHIILGHYKQFHNAVCARLAGEQCLNWTTCDSSSPAYEYVKDMFM